MSTCVFLKPDATTPEGRERRNKVERFIKAAIAQSGLTLLGEDNAKEEIVVTDVSTKVIAPLYQADVVVVDANCYEDAPGRGAFGLSPLLYYLVALSHSRGNQTILVAENVSHLPRSFVREHTIDYKKVDFDAIEQFKDKFQEVVTEIINENNDKPDNPIQEYLRDIQEKDKARRIAQLESEVERLKRDATADQIRASEQLRQTGGRIKFRPI